MVKFGILKKQSKALGSAHPTGSDSIIKDLTSSIAPNSYRGIFEDHQSYNEAIKLMMKFLPAYLLFGAFDSFKEAFPLVIHYKWALSAFRPSHNPHEVPFNLVDDTLVVPTKEKFTYSINLRILPSMKFYTPSSIDVFSALYQIGYKEKLKGVGEFKKSKLNVIWQFVFHFVIK